MLTGKSVLHVEQSIGKCFVPGDIKGYYNDLTKKVLLDPGTLKNKELPKMYNDDGDEVVFATTIFQYGLGCYDLILLTGNVDYIEQFKKCLDWAIENQEINGGWDISSIAGIHSPYGAMAQGEGVSLLLRGYVFYGDDIFYQAAKKGIDLMLTPIKDGGTSDYNGNDLVFYEFVDCPCVLNGWIFAFFGLYDFVIACGEEKYKLLMNKSIETIKRKLIRYDCGYWSKYNDDKAIASPFYHKLHIAQLSALMTIDEDDTISFFYNKFIKYQKNPIYRIRAFLKKAFQKLFEH